MRAAVTLLALTPALSRREREKEDAHYFATGSVIKPTLSNLDRINLKGTSKNCFSGSLGQAAPAADPTKSYYSVGFAALNPPYI